MADLNSGDCGMGFLHLERVSKLYGEFAAVRDFDLEIEQGEFISLLGPSGCGKTTTLQMIAGLVAPTDGRIALDGRDITREKPARRGLGVVFQSYALFPHMTVAQNVAFGLEMRKIAKAERDRQVAEILSLVQLAALADRYPREMSGGQRQRVAIARALVIKPPVLLLDEPLSNLDAKLREEMQFELRRIQRVVGITTIMVTHDQAEALSISDRVVVMEGGRITQVDHPYSLYEHPKNNFISSFVGKSNFLAARAVKETAGVSLLVDNTDLKIPATGNYPGGELCLSVRPEKIRLTDPASGMLRGSISSRYFLGNQWLLSVATPAGEISVSVANLGAPPPSEGEVTGLAWNMEECRILAAEQEGILQS
jgi:putative spermidine/putrescine transport system ATP-binding protein